MMVPESKYFSGKLRLRKQTLGPTTIINAANISVCCSLTKLNVESAPSRLFPQTIKCINNSVRLEDFTTDGQRVEQASSQLCLTIGRDHGKMGKNNLLSKLYRCLYNEQESKLRLTLFPSQQLSFTLHGVDKPKFAKTEKLESLLCGQGEQSGILTMDQMGRILVESNECGFPAVGLWLKCNSLHQAAVYLHLYAYVRRKPNKQFTKLLSAMDQHHYIYFAKIQENEIPELYLASQQYEEPGPNPKETSMEYQLQHDQNIVLELNQEYLEFTLRGQDASRKKQSQFASPKKEMTNEELEEQLDKLHLQESPQFSSIKKQAEQDWAEERTLLKQRVEAQQLEIQTLKKEVERLKKQLASSKNGVRSPQCKPLNFFRSPILMSNSSTPGEKCKKLSSSDLESSNSKFFQSGSTKEKNSLEENSGSNCNSHSAKEVLECGQQPWDIYEIIEATE